MSNSIGTEEIDRSMKDLRNTVSLLSPYGREFFWQHIYDKPSFTEWIEEANKECERKRRILMLGLDGAGKTTILYLSKLGELVNTINTIGFNVEDIKHK